MTKALATAPPPPGETGRELSFSEVETILLTLTAPPDVHLEVNALSIRRFKGRAIVDVGFTNGHTVTLRIAERRVRDLRDRLNIFLDHQDRRKS